MIFELLRLIIAIFKIIYTIIITFIVYLYDYNSTIINKFLENLNIYGSIENLDKYYNFKKKHSNGIALFTHTSYLDGIILAKELKEPPSFVCFKAPLTSYMYDIAKKWKCLIIEPKQNNTKIITNNVLERNINEPLLFIAPTGANLEQKNKFKLEEFRTGAFVSLSPVLPILISYSPHIYVKESDNMLSCMIDIINIEKLTYKIKIIDPIYPNKNDTIETFKNRVYKIMNLEKNKIIIEDIIPLESNKKIFTIIIILIIFSYFIFSKNINLIIFFSLIILLFITITLRNKNKLFNYLYKNLIYIYSAFFTIYSTFNSNYLLFINSIIYPFIYKYFSK
jgi:1-acyl-sn-glycerol-3-phosphate acyltransferase